MDLDEIIRVQLRALEQHVEELKRQANGALAAMPDTGELLHHLMEQSRQAMKSTTRA